MRIYNSIEDFPSDINTIVTIGTFDGVHKGHQTLINRINEIADKEGLESVLLTFHPHPRQVLFPEDQQLRLIHTNKEKQDALQKISLQHLVIHEFTKSFSRTKSVNFIRDLLINRLNMKYMIVGYNHQFGRNREGGYDNLLELSEIYDFKIEKIQPQIIDGVSISSTKIRDAIKNGDIKKANKYLCDNFSISGKVIKGNGIGSTIGFPTANIEINNQWKILPADGVYAVKVHINHSTSHYAMLNIGKRPTILDNRRTIEVYIFDFQLDIYESNIRVEFFERIRDEKKFDSLEGLKVQLEFDKVECQNLFKIL